ncbi:dipeptide epimerase [Terracoccus luteus]|uniref:Dipeptide epimerase n=1 Tax=Terracoccus luteus TaxID=53356 RepID=A0A839PPU4_9MICO|nr:dipeptide epimerase [Terracoccus luteus]MBB2985109.1 L-alanine-DL-glutamate epimerase-like enolase superfamily enzyme [Terracoccus luteus]MCP2170761.1 L-alanine-DL-glutamate epimerase-like enolase superfamily enzyme [Terracoccus luteus]
MTRIETVTATTTSVPLHTPFVTALRRTTTTDTVVVTVTDSDGRTGWGEAPQVWQVTGESLAGATACVRTMLSPAVTGLALDDRDDLDVALTRVQRTVARNFGAKAALDAALHDLFAQSQGTTVAAVVRGWVAGSGGPTPDGGLDGIRLTTDVTLSAGDASALADTARARVADGFATLKMKVGTDAATDVARVAAVRAAVGADVGIRLDVNQGWSREEAVEVIRALADAGLGVELVEQPVVAEDVEGLAWVRERVPLPVMADESCYGPFDLERIIRLGAADLVNVKLAKCGSLRTGAALLHRAHEAGLGTIVGSMMETHVGLGAAASLVAAVPTTLVSDLDAAWWAARSPVAGGIAYEGEAVLLPSGPGLGVTGWVVADADRPTTRA